MGFVYFIREADLNAFKVGCSGSREGVGSRLINLQIGNPRELKLFGLIESMDWTSLEYEIQDTWDNLKIRGEWYRFTDVQVRFLLKAYNGQVIFDVPTTIREQIIKISGQSLKDVCKQKLDGTLDISIRQIACDLDVKKWEVETMLKELQNVVTDLSQLHPIDKESS